MPKSLIMGYEDPSLSAPCFRQNLQYSMEIGSQDRLHEKREGQINVWIEEFVAQELSQGERP